MQEKRKTCKRCLLENAVFGKNKNTYDGLSYWCKLCMAESRIRDTPQDWTEMNRARRANKEYRDKEREAANQRDKERRQYDYQYVAARSASNRKWKDTGDVESKKAKANARQAAKAKKAREALSVEEIEQRRLNQIKGIREYNRYRGP